MIKHVFEEVNPEFCHCDLENFDLDDIMFVREGRNGHVIGPYNEWKREAENVLADIDENMAEEFDVKILEWAEGIKEWPLSIQDVINYMNCTETEGRRWDYVFCTGYCQGDYVAVIYCEPEITEGIACYYGDMYNGCYKEFSYHSVEEEEFRLYGYYVTDCQINWKDSDNSYKERLCEWTGVNPEETEVKFIENLRHVPTWDWRTV